MPSLRIPERFRDGIIKVAEISDDGFNQLQSALTHAPECSNVKELSAWIAQETPALAEVDRTAILKAVVPMSRVQRSADVSPAIFASDIWASLQQNFPASVESLSGKTLKARIVQLLEIQSLDLISTKMAELKSEIERSFCSARVLTDLRPVFKNSVEDEPAAMLVLHTLQLGYHDGMGKHHEFYITLGPEEIEKLQKALARAKQKAATLVSLLGKTGIKTA